MAVKQKQVDYIACDGCGYVISPKEGYLILTPMLPGEKAEDLHFHLPAPDKDRRSWGTRDCLGYWHVNRKARNLSSGTDGVGGLAWKNALKELEEKR